MTLTRCALGAHTAKCTPVTPPIVSAVRAELLPRAVVRALAEQMQVEVGQDLAELVGIDDVARDVAFVHAEAVGEVARRGRRAERRLEQPVGTPPRASAYTPVVGVTSSHVATPPAASSG